MTRNTSFYKIKATINKKPKDIYYHDLTAAELYALNKIKNDIIRYELAAALSIDNIDVEELTFPIKVQIGEDVIRRSSRPATDGTYLDILITDARETVKTDPTIAWISHITKYFPGTSIVDLFNLTIKDLIELCVLAEEMSGEKIFGGSKKKGMSLVNPMDLPDGGKALREQIKNLNTTI